ncbi:MAG TPA: RIP metalloprotease RseP [Candidatus Limnocylindrales bacterium]|nr:RIP metalloprotease RseP [Candidatus Limnocylindrales bacterium]
MAVGSMLAAVLVLAIVIFVHELGHFLAGKWNNVEVRVFSMGFGPTLFARKFGETVYRLALVPLGGYVRMAGYDEEGGDDEDAPADPRRGFTSKSLAARATIVAAGPAVNLIFAALLFTFCAYVYGVSVPSDKPVVEAVAPGQPAEAGGLKAGDTVVAVDSRPITKWEDLLDVVVSSGGKALTFEVIDESGARRTAVVTPKLAPRYDEFGEEGESVFQIGVLRSEETQEVGLTRAASVGVQQTAGYSWMIVQTVARLFQGRLSAGDLGGPILIAREASRQARSGLRPLLIFMALISVNLGIVNLLPIPVLDGGHLAFMAFEAVRGKPLSLRVREYALQVGMVLIGALMIFVVFNDIVRIVAG